jgi:cell division initiation protein
MDGRLEKAMERITPLDLQRAELPTAWRGFDKKSVETLLARAAESIEALTKENRRLADSLRQSEADLERFRLQESTLREALVLAQKAADEARSNAQRQADLTMAEAEQQARETRRQAHESVRALTWEAERLKEQRSHFESAFRALLQEHLARLDAIGRAAVVALEEEPEAVPAALRPESAAS